MNFYALNSFSENIFNNFIIENIVSIKPCLKEYPNKLKINLCYALPFKWAFFANKFRSTL